MIFGQMETWVMEEGVGGFRKRHWCFFIVAQSNYSVQPHYPGMGRGLV
jgi:hypothetical protein